MTDVTQKIPIICPIHGMWDTTSIAHHSSGHGCADCAIDKRAKIRRKTKEEWISIFRKLHGNKYDYSLFLSDNFILKNGYQKISIKCPIHGVWVTTTIYDHSFGCGCPTCKSSKGEKQISTILNDNNISFKTQKKFKECKLKRQLPFDFYLPEQNLCIEYDGRQHFEAVDYFGGKEALKLQKKKDRIKTKYCKDNGIKLLRIRYDEDIEEKMKELLNERHS